MYNVLEKLRSGETLTAKDKTIHEQGLVSVLKQLHEDLDKAVCDAYGWPDKLSDGEILDRLVALNAERAAEEAQGKVRWLRPDFQSPQDSVGEQTEMTVGDIGKRTPNAQRSTSNIQRSEWPKALPDQVRALRDILAMQSAPASVETIARHFRKARKDRVAELLQTLVAMGQARMVDNNLYVA
jgi:hypothetical protein